MAKLNLELITDRVVRENFQKLQYLLEDLRFESPGWEYASSGAIASGSFIDNGPVSSGVIGKKIHKRNLRISSVQVLASASASCVISIQKKLGPSAYSTILQVELNSETEKYQTVNCNVSFGDEISVKVTGGSITDPSVVLTIERKDEQ